MKGLYLNTPPKPKQARTVELQEAEQQELEVDRSLEEETEVKAEKKTSEQEAAAEWKPGRTLWAVLQGAHGGLERNQQCSFGAGTA